LFSYLIRRLIFSVFVVFFISLIVFFAVRLTGDPAAVMFGAGQPTKEAVLQLRHNLGLDRPLIVQYGIFLKQLVTFDLGESFRTGKSVAGMITEKMGATLTLAIAGIVVSILIAFPVGIISAVKRGKFLDFGGRIFSMMGISFPNFWLGIMMIMVFAVVLKWFPASGYEGPQYLVLPALTLGLIMSSILARLVRSSMLDVLNQQYIKTAHSKGIHEWAVIIRHAFRNALLPTITFIGLQFGSLLGGTVIIEQVFSWPGVGRMIIQAISERDYPVVQGGVIVLALIMVFVNLLVDLSYGVIDPRIKVGGGKS
jgi:peptide/nickel transport system permease protein